MDRGWKLGMLAAVAVSSMALGACGDDEPDPVSQSAYDGEADRLCERHDGAELLQEDPLLAGAPDAERVSFLLAEYVPRIRAIVQELASFGYPVDKAAGYRNAEARALDALDEIEDEAPALVDRLVAGTLDEDEDPFLYLDVAVGDLELPCA